MLWLFLDNHCPQVAQLRTKLALPDDFVAVNCDSISIRAFVTYMVHRHDGSVRREFRWHKECYTVLPLRDEKAKNGGTN